MNLPSAIPPDPARLFHAVPPAPAPEVSAARAPAPPARFARRHVALALSFALCVALPVLVSAWYLWARAADQFASEAGFAVRREEAGLSADMLGGIAGLSGVSSRDTDILYQYLTSRRLVAELEADLALSVLWSKPGNDAEIPVSDPVFALGRGDTPEDLHRYWARRVQISYDSLAGLIELRVTAFAPGDAQAIVQGIVARATLLINEMSDVAQADAIAGAAAELEAAETRLQLARAQMTAFRNRNQLVDPAMDLQTRSGLLGNLQQQLAEALIALDLLREATRAEDPRIEQGARRVAVIEARIAAERAKLGLEGGGAALADVVGAYEALVAEREFAETAYAAARGAYEMARAEARRQSRYLAAWQAPTLPQTAEYPRRARLLALTLGFSLLLWGLAALAGYAAMDRRG
ncbi:hypothetical protein [Marivita sp. GX14005]|uniref:hypothetical protein n=1 Tax=Marivita sp. GX14005 TaxID=2942276 RepID=UPI00201882A1|nr:hypothetical protein [Marivita sp. GX14005]MCL3883971.1 hypothetical protein [Marivita sp. GX14005]